MEKLMKCHADQISIDYAGCSNDKEIRQRAIQLVEKRKTKKDITERKLAYLYLSDPSKFKIMVDAEMTAAKARLSGDYEEMPNFDASGYINFDLICRACGNAQFKEKQCRLYEFEKAWLDSYFD